jgi:hypothetical protein
MMPDRQTRTDIRKERRAIIFAERMQQSWSKRKGHFKSMQQIRAEASLLRRYCGIIAITWHSPWLHRHSWRRKTRIIVAKG